MIIDEIKKNRTYDAIEYFAEMVLCPLVPADVEGDPDPGATPVMVPKTMSPGELQDAVDKVAGWIARIPGLTMRDTYIDKIFSRHKKVISKKTNLATAVKNKVAHDEKVNSERPMAEMQKDAERWLPEGVELIDVLDNGGFFQQVDREKTGIYFLKGTDGKSEPERVAEFTIDPVFHKYDRDDNCRIIKVNNGFHGDQYIEMPTTALVSVDVFQKFLLDRGVYEWQGTKMHLNRIRREILPKFPKAYEIKTLGWQPEGFFAYYNAAVIDGHVVNYTSAGLVKVGEKYFYSPSISEAFAEERKENDMYKNDRYLSYTPPSLNFEAWTKLVHKVYPTKSISIILGCLLALHRDIHFEIDRNAPHIYFHGEKGSGKSKAMDTMSSFFFKGKPGFALSSGTDHAFAQSLSRFRNGLAVNNELDTDMVKKERINMLKEAYDGNARERGIGSSRHKTESQSVESLLGLVGQFLAMVDDGSLVSRSIVEKFHQEAKRPKAQSEAYELLKQHESEGLGGLIAELLPYRGEIEKNYYRVYHEIMHGLAADMRKNKDEFQERVLRNYSGLVAINELFAEHFTLPWKPRAVYDWAYEQIGELSTLLSQSDVLVKFWTVLESMVSEGIMRYGRHYKVEDGKKIVRVSPGGGKPDEQIHLDEPTEVMYLRLRPVHVLYSKVCRSTGERPMDITSLETYMRDREYCIGRVNSEHFAESMSAIEGHSRAKTGKFSAWIIDMKKANIHESGFTTMHEYTEQPKDDAGEEGKNDLPF